MKRIGRSTSLVISCLLFSSCGGSGDSPVVPDNTPASIALTPPVVSIVSGGSSQLTAQVKNKRGDIISAQGLAYVSSAPGIATVSAAGVVSAVGPVGTAAIVASIGAITSVPTAVTVSAGAVAHFAQQTGLPASPQVASSNAISVKATDAFGNAIPGAAVTFAVTAGGGATTPSTATTDASGIAVTSFQLGTHVGPNTAVATATGLSGSQVIFTATTVAGPASSSAIAPGSNNQTAPAGTTVPASVIVTDSYGNPVQGVFVTFSTGSGGVGSVALIPTNANGIATFQWNLSAGTNTIYANAGSFPQMTLTATGT